MAKQLREPEEALYPAPVVLVTCIDEKGRSNIITLAWVGIICSEPPMIGISIRPSRYSNSLIKESKEFVVNIPTVDLLRKVDYCGTVSGKTVDKFKEAGFTPESAAKVRSSLIKECPVNIECKLKQQLTLGVHDLFLGEVVAIHTTEEILNEEGKIDYAKAKPLVFNQGEYWNLGKKLENYGFSQGRIKEIPFKSELIGEDQVVA